MLQYRLIAMQVGLQTSALLQEDISTLDADLRVSEAQAKQQEVRIAETFANVNLRSIPAMQRYAQLDVEAAAEAHDRELAQHGNQRGRFLTCKS